MKHRHGWESAAPESDAAAPASVPRLSVFFFFFFHGFAPTQLGSPRFALDRDDSARIGRYWPNRVESASNQNMMKSDLNRTVKIGFE